MGFEKDQSALNLQLSSSFSQKTKHAFVFLTVMHLFFFNCNAFVQKANEPFAF